MTIMSTEKAQPIIVSKTTEAKSDDRTPAPGIDEVLKNKIGYAPTITEKTPFANSRHRQDRSAMSGDYYSLSESRNKKFELVEGYKQEIDQLEKKLYPLQCVIDDDFVGVQSDSHKQKIQEKVTRIRLEIEAMQHRLYRAREKARDENFAVQGIRPSNENHLRNPGSHRDVYTNPQNPEKHIFYENHITDPSLPTIICIPGVGANGSMYHGVMRRLQTAANSIILDRFNQGYSSHSDQAVGFEQQVHEYTEALKSIISEKGIANYQLLGHSYGGNLARRISDNLEDWASESVASEEKKQMPKPSGVVSISSTPHYGLPGTKQKDTSAPVTDFRAHDQPRTPLTKFAHFPWLSYFKNRRKADGKARNNHEKREQSLVRKTYLTEGGRGNVLLSFISAEHDFIAPMSAMEQHKNEFRKTSPLYTVPGAAHSGMVTSAPQMALAVLQACGLDKERITTQWYDKETKETRTRQIPGQDTPLIQELRQEAQVKQYLDDGNPYATPIQRTLLDAYYKAGNFGTRALAWLRNTLKV